MPLLASVHRDVTFSVHMSGWEAYRRFLLLSGEKVIPPFSRQVLVGEVWCNLQQLQVVRRASICHLNFLFIDDLFW